MKGLSKSRYTAFCQCPKNLWLKVYHPDVATIDPGVEARFEQGNEVGDLAMGLFGPYEEVTIENPDGGLDLTKMCALTQKYMNDGVDNICEASFAIDGHYCAVDILRRNGEGWDIYEVKSTSFPMFNEKPSKLEKYVPDIAYQKWVLMQCGVNVTGTYLVCLNSDYVKDGAVELKKLFVIKDMQKLVDKMIDEVGIKANEALRVIANDEEPMVDLSEHCRKPYQCAFWAYCKELHGVPKPSVFDVYGGSNKSKKEDTFYFPEKLKLYQAGKMSFADLNDDVQLGRIQRLQVNGKEYVNKEGIREYLNRLSFPLYFLDFETMQYAVPRYDGTIPYQQVPFQYSLHIKESANAPYQHKEFLAPSDGSDPRRALAEQLCDDIPMGVCILAYNKDFERNRIKELAAAFPDLSEHLLDIEKNIKDLIDPFRDGYFYEPAMEGSFSIKSVLPALFPDDPSLNYHNLTGGVQNGGEAMDIFPKIQFMTPADAKAARAALLEYCKLDTWAMVKVWEKLNEKAK